MFEPLASAAAILTDDEKELGVAIVDIGGGTTDIILYKDGWLRHTSVLAIGGNHFTNDIAVGLRMSVTEAERVKKQYGHAITDLIDDSEEVEIIQAGQGRKILRRHLSEIIQPRTEELIHLIKNELTTCSGYDMASTGVVLTGGGSLLAGFDGLAESILKLPVRKRPLQEYGVRGRNCEKSHVCHRHGACTVWVPYRIRQGIISGNVYRDIREDERLG